MTSTEAWAGGVTTAVVFIGLAVSGVRVWRWCRAYDAQQRERRDA